MKFVEKQCSKCPWKVSTEPGTIPNGYSLEKHKALKSTIVEGFSSTLRVMACHETHQSACGGWMYNQLGVGNNLGLRMRMRNKDLSSLEIEGEQHEKFEDTYNKSLHIKTLRLWETPNCSAIYRPIINY